MIAKCWKSFSHFQPSAMGRGRACSFENAALDDAEQIFSSFMVKWHGTRHTGCNSTWIANYPYKLRLRAVFHTPDIAAFRHPGDFTSYFNLPECPALRAARLLLLSPAFVAGWIFLCFFCRFPFFSGQLLRLPLSWPACPKTFILCVCIICRSCSVFCSGRICRPAPPGPCVFCCILSQKYYLSSFMAHVGQ